MKHKLFIPMMAAVLCGASCISCKKVDDTNATASNIGHNMQDLEVFYDSIAPRYMGLISITKGDSVIFSKKIGYSDVDTKEAITDTTPFKIGSLSKSFTAILTLKAIEAGKLSMDDKLVKFFPDTNIPNADKITIYHLLHHRSGLQDYLNETNGEAYAYMYTPQTKAQMLERFSNLKTNFEPGEQYRYCNTGYSLLGYILEQVYSKKFGDLIDEQIVKPLDLTNTYCLIDSTIATKSYNFDESWIEEKRWDPSVEIGAGSIVSTLKDLKKYTCALGEGFFGKEILSQMIDFVDGYGCGVRGEKSQDGKVKFSHAGLVECFSSFMEYDDGQVTISLANGLGVHPMTVKWSIEQAMKGDEFYIPSFQFVSLDSGQLDKFIGKYHCDNDTFDFVNDGKNLTIEHLAPWPIKLEAKSQSYFQSYKEDIEVDFFTNNDSIRFRIGPENKVYKKINQ